MEEIRGIEYVIGWHAGCPGEDDTPIQAEVDTTNQDYQDGFSDGQAAFNSLATRYPHLINESGVIRADRVELPGVRSTR